MRQLLTGGLVGLACLALQASWTPAKALVIAPSPMPDRVAGASTIVVGKVTAIEEKTVTARPNPQAAPVEYQIAVVEVKEALLGAKGLTHVRVGFIPLPPAVPPPPGGPIRPPIGRVPRVTLAKDQEVCLFLTPVAKETFFTAPMYYDIIDKTNPNFDKEVAQIRRYVKLLADPKASLKSNDPQDRLTTAYVLLNRYRTARATPKGLPKQEPIDAEESRLILQAIAGADWNRQPTAQDNLVPMTVFSRLGLTAKDGWVPAKGTVKERNAAAQKWLTDNADKYRIQRYVPESAEK